MVHDRRMRWLQRGLLWWAAISFAVVAYDLAFDGFYFNFHGIRISSYEVYKPFRNGVVCVFVAAWLHDRRGDSDSWWDRLVSWSPPLAAGTALVSALMAIHFGIFVAGGADAYGYVSQAALWTSGRLTVPDPLAPIGRVLDVNTAPLGYRPARIAGSIVPTYSPGLPIAMALASKLAGDSAVYVVVPACAGLAVWMTFLLGSRVNGPRTGLAAAVLLTCSPIFLFQSLEPMSDVPITALYLVAWVLALNEGLAPAAFAGLTVSAAVLTRPNLVPVAVVLLIVVTHQRPRFARGLLFLLGVVPGCLAVATLNWHLYGTPFTSGYGALADLFEWRNLVPNIQRYPMWLVQLHSPGILLALIAPFVIRREPAPDGRPDDRRRVPAWMLAFFGAVVLCYLFYTPYDDWPYLRFLLPAIPLLLVLSLSVVVTLIGRAPAAMRAGTLFALCTLLGCWCLLTANRLGTFGIASSERRYVAVGEYLRFALPPNALVLTVIESGSVRLYGLRPTLRWDMVPPDKLDQTIETLRASGYVPYILLEDWEEKPFRERFGRANIVGNVEWPPAIVCYGPITVRVYSLDDRLRHLVGEPVLARVVPRT